MVVKKSIRLESKIDTQIQQIAERKSTTFTQVVEDALKLYIDYDSMENATFINQDIKKTFAAEVSNMEKRMLNRTNKVLSETAIQLGILTMIIGNNVEIAPGAYDSFRTLVVEYLKTNNMPLRLNEVLEDA